MEGILLGNNALTDEGLRALADAPGLPALRYLLLRNVPVREEMLGAPPAAFRSGGDVKRGVLQGIKATLHLRLPEQEQALLARVEQVDDLELLGRILDAASAADVEQLNKLLSC